MEFSEEVKEEQKEARQIHSLEGFQMVVISMPNNLEKLGFIKHIISRQLETLNHSNNQIISFYPLSVKLLFQHPAKLKIRPAS